MLSEISPTVQEIFQTINVTARRNQGYDGLYSLKVREKMCRNQGREGHSLKEKAGTKERKESEVVWNS
jgi:hypothetical protein